MEKSNWPGSGQSSGIPARGCGLTCTAPPVLTFHLTFHSFKPCDLSRVIRRASSSMSHPCPCPPSCKSYPFAFLGSFQGIACQFLFSSSRPQSSQPDAVHGVQRMNVLNGRFKVVLCHCWCSRHQGHKLSRTCDRRWDGGPICLWF